MSADELTKHEKYDLALQGEEVRPDWVPDLQWHGKMTGPISDFCTSMIAAGHPDTEIHNTCLTYFGGPATITPIRRLHDTHASAIAEKVEQLSRQIADIPITRKAYRMKVLNRMLLEVMDRFYNEVPTETPSNIEKLTRAAAKILGMSRDEMEGDNVHLEQNNIYIEAVNNVSLEELEELQNELTSTHSKIQKALGGGDEQEEAIDAEFEAEDDDD